MSNDILTILSSLGKISFEKYKKIVDMLLKRYSQDNEQYWINFSHFKLLQDLEALAHCEIDYEGRNIYIFPPTFALLPQRGLPKILLLGGRSDKLIKRLQKIVNNNSELVRVSVYDQPLVDMSTYPKAYICEAKSKYILAQIVNKLGIEGNLDIPVSYSLLSIESNVDDILNSLKYSEMQEPNWSSKIFCYKRLSFTIDKHRESISLISYINPFSQQEQTWLWNGRRAAKVDKNWGRYALLKYKKRQVLLYDYTKHRLGVPSNVPLPKQLAQAITLCSGLLPRRIQIQKPSKHIEANSHIDVFERVPKDLAINLSKKLGQELIKFQL